MKSKKTLLYDDACPLCAWYTGAFVKTGLLGENGRIAFSTASPELLQCIDQKRGVNEIPLIDHETKEVLYGIDALVAVIGQRCPIVRVLGRKDLVKWPLKKIYNFIAYNRKVIVARKAVEGSVDCTPDFNIFYRLLFMTVFLCFNTIMLFPVHGELLANIPFFSISLIEFHLAHAIIVCINCLLAIKLTRKEAIEYLGQVNMLALLTILLLIPLVLLNKWIAEAGWLNYIWFFVLTMFIIKEYFRRMEFAGITQAHTNIVALNLASIAGFVTSLFVL
jgi:hypothetical protein